jgi:DeoR/GlpR family transcriptional regulator of sugar metabolism
MAHQSFAGRVLETLTNLAATATAGSVHVDDISHALMIQTRQAHKQVLNALSDLSKAGKVIRVRMGVYAMPVAGQQRPPDKREVMWRILRMRKRVLIADLVELAGVSREYAKEWLQMLAKRGIVRRISQPDNQPHIWQMIHDTVDMPVDEVKAAKLRALRRKKSAQAMADLLTARELIGKACLVINELEADHE